MGLFDFFSRDRKVTPAQSAPTVETQQVDFAPLVPMAAIISNNDAQVAADIATLAQGYEAFRTAHPDWCAKMRFGDPEPEQLHATIRDAFVYWLAGYDTPFVYGAYIDWKEATDDIVGQLKRVADSLGLSLDLAEIPFPGDEHTEAALQQIAGYVRERGYALTVIDTESDSYHLYLVPQAEYDRMVALGASVGFRVYSPA
ncbi:hypothetical protein [Microbacterium sp. ZW T5_56]|uniref:DUF6630 family protein n=1 Tax=Microbacterium sp. ZW T5_56 TaxID=3378081 RepID=UPI0038528DFD